MNINDRRKMVLCMEYISRNINDEEIFMNWLSLGVADGDVEYGNLDIHSSHDIDYYVDDETFSSLMKLFLVIMSEAKKSGGLYCDGVVS